MPSDANFSPGELLRSLLGDFCGIDDAEAIDAIARSLSLVELDAGQILFRMGERSEDIYFVLSGRLRAFVEREHQVPETIGDVARGETVGELALLTGKPRVATIMALRTTLLARMTRSVFEATIGRHPGMAVATMRIVVERFLRLERKRRAPQRLSSICLVAVTDGVDVAAFARRLADVRTVYDGTATVLHRHDLEAAETPGETTDAAALAASYAHRIGIVEARSGSVILVADADAGAWTQVCIRSSDEVLLLARADARRDVSDVEATLLDGDDSHRLARQTLILLHADDARSPVATASWLDRRRVARHFHVRMGLDRDMHRLARILAGRAIGLVLSGGGARGFAHIGVINALAQAGIEPDVVGGTSIGSVMGAWRAMDVRGEDLVRAGRKAFVDSGGPTGDYNLLPFISLIKGARTRTITENAVREATGADIDVEDTWVTFFCVAANYSTSTEAVLTRGPLAKSILASYAIPGALPPILLDGHLHVDGGAVNNLPVDIMEGYGVGTIIAVDLLSDVIHKLDLDWIPRTRDLLLDRMRPRSRRRFRLPSLGEILLNASVLHSVGRQRLMRDRADVCFRPVLSRVGMLDWKKYDVVVRAGHDSAVAALSSMDEARLAALRGLAPRSATEA